MIELVILCYSTIRVGLASSAVKTRLSEKLVCGRSVAMNVFNVKICMPEKCQKCCCVTRASLGQEQRA